MLLKPQPRPPEEEAEEGTSIYNTNGPRRPSETTKDRALEPDYKPEHPRRRCRRLLTATVQSRLLETRRMEATMERFDLGGPHPPTKDRLESDRERPHRPRHLSLATTAGTQRAETTKERAVPETDFNTERPHRHFRDGHPSAALQSRPDLPMGQHPPSALHSASPLVVGHPPSALHSANPPVAHPSAAVQPRPPPLLEEEMSWRKTYPPF